MWPNADLVCGQVPTYDGSQAASTALRMDCRITAMRGPGGGHNLPDRCSAIRGTCTRRQGVTSPTKAGQGS